MNCYIVRYGEIALKGGNRNLFEKRLVKNIKDNFKENNKTYTFFKKERGRIIIYSDEDLSCLKYVFGITSFSYANEVTLDLDTINRECLKLIKDEKTFAISANRADKNFFLSSMELQREVGSFICLSKKIKVNLNNPEIKIYIEILNNKSYIYVSYVTCLGGLPIGTSGIVFSLIEENILASLLFMKRGCSVIPFGFNKKDISLLNKYGCHNSFIKIKSLSELDEIIIQKKISSLVVDQTLENIKDIQTNLVVFRPLISYNLESIKEKLCLYK